MGRRKYRFKDRAEAEAEHQKAEWKAIFWEWAWKAQANGEFQWGSPIPVSYRDSGVHTDRRWRDDGTAQLGWFLTPRGNDLVVVLRNNGDPASFEIGRLDEMRQRVNEAWRHESADRRYWSAIGEEIERLAMAHRQTAAGQSA